MTVPRRMPALALALFLVAGCDGDPTDPPGNGGPPPPGGGGGGGERYSWDIEATDQLTFVSEWGPGNRIEIEEGSSVRWVSTSSQPHTVTPDGHEEFSRGEAEVRGEIILEHEFLTPGQYKYYCERHVDLGMVGTVIVRER